MALSHKARKRWAMVVLLVGLPAYIVVAVSVVNRIDAAYGRQPIWLELIVYVGLGLIWAFPFKHLFRGIGQADPHASTQDEKKRP